MTSSPKKLLPLLALVLALSACGDAAPDKSQAPAATVTTTQVVAKPWSDAIEALGTANANESVLVTAKVTETVVRVNFEDGDLAKEGQVLVDLSGGAEIAGLEEVTATLHEAQLQYRRLQELNEKKLIPQSQLDAQRGTVDAARARLNIVRARLADRVITAPFAGVLGFRQVSPGTLVSPGTTIASLDDISVIKLDFTVPETYLAALAQGQAVSARSAAFPDREFTGTVTTIDLRVDPVTRAVTVRAELPNPDRLLRPGMLLTLHVFQPERQALVIPEIAIVQVAREARVFRVGADDTVEQVVVTVGQRRSGEVEITGGLAAGDRIVVDGTVKLRQGSRILDAGAAPAAAEAENSSDAAPARDGA